MAIKNCKITEAGMNANGIVAAPDTLKGSAQENKELFDRLVKQVVALQFNTLLEELLASTAAGELGMEPVGELDAKTVQEGFRLLTEALKKRISKVDGSVKGRLPVLQEDGALKDGGVLLEDVLLRLVSAKVGNLPAFDAIGKLRDSGVNIAELLGVSEAAADSAEAAARSAEIAREIAGGDVVSETELREAVAALEKKDVFIATKGVTTWDELEAARKAGRRMVLQWTVGVKVYQAGLYMYDDNGSDKAYIFRKQTSSGGVQTHRLRYDGGSGTWYDDATVYPSPANIGAAVVENVSATLPYSGWTTSGNYVYKAVTVAGILSTDTPIVDIRTGTDNAANVKYQSEFGKVFRIVTATNKLTFYATAAPTTNIPVQVKVVR